MYVCFITEKHKDTILSILFLLCSQIDTLLPIIYPRRGSHSSL